MKKNEAKTAMMIVAKEFGRIAFNKGLKAPAQDKNIMGMIENGMDHKLVISLFDAWLKGWHSENLK